MDLGRARSRRALSLLAGLGLTVAACAGAPRTGAEAGDRQPFHPDGWAGIEDVPRDLFDPVAAGEPPPEGYRPVVARDVIAPVYAPSFVEADQIDWPDEELIIGVDLAGEARAYPVGFLNRREIVVDMHRGIPTFVTW